MSTRLTKGNAILEPGAKQKNDRLTHPGKKKRYAKIAVNCVFLNCRFKIFLFNCVVGI